MQYLYNDGDLYYFMDTDTYEQLPIGADNPQNKALMGALQMLNPQMPDLFEMAGDKNLISLGLEGKAKMAVGVNLGVMWDINEQWSLGFTYRSKLKMKVDSGSIDLRMIDNTQIAQVIGQLLPQLGLDPAKLTSAVVKTELPLPASLTWGVSFRPEVGVRRRPAICALECLRQARRQDSRTRQQHPRAEHPGQR